MNLSQAFARSAADHAHKTAVCWGNAEYSYADIARQTGFASRSLKDRFRVRPGDRVGIWLKNCPQFMPAYFGILHADCVVVPINNFLKPDEVNYIIKDAGIDVLITDAELGKHHRSLEAARPQLKFFHIEEFDAGQGKLDPQFSSQPATALAVLIYTSGTTGHPKGAMLSHANLLHNVNSCRIVLETVAADRFAVILPLFHSYMMTVGMLLPLLLGGSMVLVKSLHPIKNMLLEILQHRASIMPAIPQFFRSLVSFPGDLELPMRVFVSGAAPLPAQVLHDFEARFKVPLIEGYGLSEASPVVTKNPLRGIHKPGSIGIPIANVDVSVQDEKGTFLGVGQIGEICVRGGNVMMGYWNQPEETARAMRGDWLLTGDIGCRDEDGYFYITDRKKDLLLVNGINVYPREIEEVLYQFPGVKEAAVIGKPDNRKGERPVAFVGMLDGETLDRHALDKFLRHRLADYKIPRTVIVLPALPRNATGKVLKTALRELPSDD